MPLKVDGIEVSGVSLVTDSGGTLTGSVVAEGGRQLPAPLSTLRVNAVAVGPNQAVFFSPPSPDNGRVHEDGRFTLTAVSGPSTLRLTGVPAGWGISRIESDGRDLTDIPLEVMGGQTIDLRIILSDRLPEVRGSITDAKGAATEGVVLLFPEDAARWADPSAIRTARPDQSGLFRFESLRPGDYLAVALPSAARWQVADPDFLDDLRARATSVTVRLGEPEQVSLRVR